MLCSGWVELSPAAPPPCCRGEMAWAIHCLTALLKGSGHGACHLIKHNVTQVGIEHATELKHHLHRERDHIPI